MQDIRCVFEEEFMKKPSPVKTGRLIFSLLFSSVFIIGSSSLDSFAADKAGTPPLQKVTVAYSSISGNNAPLWVTQEKGFFKKYGLDVQAVLIESGTTATQALISGEIAFGHVAGAAV